MFHHAPPNVTRSGNTLKFRAVNARTHREFMESLGECIKKGCDRIVLDFGRITTAYPSGMVPIIASLDAVKREKIQIDSILPEDETLKRLFLNTNWAYFLDPRNYSESNAAHDRHLALHRFSNPTEQQHVVNLFMDIVMRTMRLQRDVISGLEWSINEMTDNVLNHAQCVDGGLAQLSTFRDARKVAFAVADSGRGILNSLREGHKHLQSDAEAIGEAIKAGVTRDPEAGQGNGLAGTMRIASMAGGTFELTSGRAQIIVKQEGTETFKRPLSRNFKGTLVYAEVGLYSSFHLAEALGFSSAISRGRVDLIEIMYETDSGDAMILHLANEASGFGNRPSGRQIRTKCQNLLDSDQSKPLILDWAGIPIVSSSFADELVGKLFVELGPTGFSARVRNLGMERLVRGLVDKAIVQRVVQSAGSNLSEDGEIEDIA